MDSILRFLDGKKAKILAIAGIVCGYLTAVGYLDAKLSTMILSILNILAGGAAVASDRSFGRSYRNR